MDSQDWTQLDEEALLEKRISDLGLTLKGTEYEGYIQQVYDELSARKLIFHPPYFLADEWFCPVGIPAIGIPFYLAHERLRKLEEKMILEVEGAEKEWFLRLMRHETAHAYSYAYHLYRKRKWQKLFGLASKEYEDTYRPRPYSRSYVINLEHWYAQSHPDEDFAETFAVWLTPNLDWREKYKDWKALPKLEYVDSLMKSLAEKPPLKVPRFREREYSGLHIKLKTYYARKRKQYEESYPDFYDRDLKRLFSATAEGAASQKASRYLRVHRRQILHSVCHWTREKKYTVNELLQDLIDRCDELGLHARTDDPTLQLNIASYITSMVMNYLFTGKFKRTK